MTRNNHSEAKVVRLFMEEHSKRPAIQAPSKTPERFLELLAQTVAQADPQSAEPIVVLPESR
ncbi:MAG: hypothetical protein K2Z81_28790 [Cyanobacteria bacterium]|nr:hypothetical protein [Cyanobacteriota bacterium]